MANKALNPNRTDEPRTLSDEEFRLVVLEVFERLPKDYQSCDSARLHYMTRGRKFFGSIKYAAGSFAGMIA